MPCVNMSTLSSALTAATATISTIYSATPIAVVPVTALNATSTVIATGAPIPSSSIAIVPTSASSAAASTSTTTPTTGNTTYAGVNIAGLDFGCTTDGTCTVSSALFPATGAAQMQHFATADNLNVFRLTVGWQYLTNDVLGGALDATNFAQYDALMQSCLAIAGAKCILDIHNYARWNGQIIGQSTAAGAPTDADLAALWTALATAYANDTDVLFGVMNEPHDLVVATWADTVQAAVTAIRAVAPAHTVLMPGSSFSSAGALPTEAGPYLLKVTNPDGSTDGLVFDVHKYLDSDGSGTSTECVSNNIDDAFAPLATWLRANGRQAMVSETGGGNTDSCVQFVCEELAFLNENSDVFMGYVGWSAGGFDSSYALALTPSGTAADAMVDTSLMTSCFAR